MKKIKLLALCVLATFASCSWFDSKPIMPKIVGAAYLQYDSEKKAYYADIDSVKHYVENIAVSNYDHFFPQMIKPVDGMKVTIFTNHKAEKLCAAGEISEQEIEELYRINYAPLVLPLCCFMVLIIVIILITNKKQKDHDNS
jgi:hypothetical protein